MLHIPWLIALLLASEKGQILSIEIICTLKSTIKPRSYRNILETTQNQRFIAIENALVIVGCWNNLCLKFCSEIKRRKQKVSV